MSFQTPKRADSRAVIPGSLTGVNHLGTRDRVALVVYAGAAGLVLPPTSCEEKEVILLVATATRRERTLHGQAVSRAVNRLLKLLQRA